MISRYIKNIALAGVLSLSASACLTDLDLEPINQVNSETVYDDFSNYKRVLAKLYGGFSLTGQEPGAGNPDVAGVDEGSSAYFRSHWNLQELPTDEAVWAWADDGYQPLNFMTWTSNNELIRGMYYRIFYQVTLANELIRETSEARLAERGVTGANLEEARNYRAEARFLRALSYYHALDLFGEVPFVTEEDAIGLFFPEKIGRADLFNYVEQELIAITDGQGEDDLLDPRANEYGRADKGAAWTLLATLYLNAETYIGEGRYDEVITNATKVINAGYALEEEYQDLFLADNHTSEEIIFPIIADGLEAQTYGVTTYLVNGPVGGDLNREEFGVDPGWSGLRATSGLVNLFEDVSGETDERAIFGVEGFQLEIEDVSTYTQGYPVLKFKNVTTTGERGVHPGREFVDTDYPLFRLADVYLMYAEAVVKGGQGGDEATALAYINQLRERAFDGPSGNVTLAEIKGTGENGHPFILNERARELHWEGHRRTDLIRYGLFTGGEYLWPWKGGVKEGTSVPASRALYPIPLDDVTANPNLSR